MKKTHALSAAALAAAAILTAGPAVAAPSTPSATSTASPTQTSSTPPATSSDPGPSGNGARSASSAAAATPELTVSPEKVSAKDFINKDKGVTVKGTNFGPGDAAVKITAPGKVQVKRDTVEVGSDGKFSYDVYGLNPKNPEAYVGKYTVSVTPPASEAGDAQNPLSTTFEVVSSTSTPKPTKTAEKKPALTISPRKVTPASFVKKNKGVNLTVVNCDANENVKFTVKPSKSKVTPLTRSQKANSKGISSWNVFGTSASNPSVYTGSYDVTATCNGTTVKGKFVVAAAAKSGGSSDKGGSSDNTSAPSSNSDLPRTGMEMGGLGLGALLLVVGGATVVMTRRRSTK